VLTELGVPWAIATSGNDCRDGITHTAGDPRRSVITRDRVKYAKPNPDLFLAAAEALGMPIHRQLRRRRQRWTCWRRGAHRRSESESCQAATSEELETAGRVSAAGSGCPAHRWFEQSGSS